MRGQGGDLERGRSIAREFARRAVQRWREGLEGIVLYGEAARGEPPSPGWVDLLVFTSYKVLLRDDLYELAEQIDRRSRTLLTLVCLTPGEARERVERADPFLLTALREGVVLHDDGTVEALRRLLPPG